MHWVEWNGESDEDLENWETEILELLKAHKGGE